MTYLQYSESYVGLVCPPEGNGLEKSDYVQVGKYYFHETEHEMIWSDSYAACEQLNLEFADVNKAERAERLIQSGFGGLNKFY